MKTVKTRWAFDTSTHLSASSLGQLWKRSGIGWKTRQVQTCRATHFGPKIQALLNEIFRCITSAINIINLYSVRYFLCWKNSEDPRKNSLWRSMSFQIQLMERGSGEEWCNLWNTPDLQVTVPENLNVLLKWFSTSAETVIVARMFHWEIIKDKFSLWLLEVFSRGSPKWNRSSKWQFHYNRPSSASPILARLQPKKYIKHRTVTTSYSREKVNISRNS